MVKLSWKNSNSKTLVFHTLFTEVRKVSRLTSTGIQSKVGSRRVFTIYMHITIVVPGGK